MKKMLILAIVLILVAVNFGVVLAAPGNNPNGFWLKDVDCGEFGAFDVWVINNHTEASFDDLGKVGITKAIYIDFGEGYELVWQVPGRGLFKKTIWCEWVIDDMHMAGDILIP